MDAFFFPSEDETPLFGVWRGSSNAARVWTLFSPIGEEEKGARRVLTDIARLLEKRGEASLLFSPRGVGDSSGEFADATLEKWRQDARAAVAETQKRAPNSQTALLGIRWGASLLLEMEAETRVAIEPIANGKSWVAQLGARRQIQSQMTEGAELDENDFGGWHFSAALRDEMRGFNLQEAAKKHKNTLIVGVGPKNEVSVPLRALSEKIEAESRAVVLPAFWNQIDYTAPEPLLNELAAWWNEALS